MNLKRRYFGTDGLRGRVGFSPITPDFILKLGWAAGKVLAREGRGHVLIGKDTRISGYMFEAALEAGLAAAGIDIQLLGPMPTPAIAYLTRTLRAQMGIVISASHNPYHDNGIKFFSSEGFKLSDLIEAEIENQIEQPLVTVESAKLGKAYRIVDAPGRYIEFCKSTYLEPISLDGLKIVVDCANGALYHIAPSVFRELGAEVIEVGVDPDGLNINDDCGSTHPEYLQKMVLFQGADYGIAVDGDGDRLVMVDHKGEYCDGDDVLYIITHYWLTIGKMKGGVVGTVMTNLGLEWALREAAIPFLRASVGDRYVIEELKKQHWLLGGEPSGHVICFNMQTTGDGIISALQVLAACRRQGKTLHEMKAGLIKLPQSLINVSIKKRQPKVLESDKLKRAIQQAKKMLGEKGRVLLRSSGTEPVIRVMVEGEDSQKVQTLAKDLAETVAQASEETKEHA